MPYIVIFNFFLVSVTLVILGRIATRRKLKEVPDGAQNVAEFVLDWFVNQARHMHPGAVSIVAPFLATLFLFILLSNLLAILPFPLIKIPPTSYYSGPLALALIAVFGIIIISGIFKGLLGALKHLVWPNPLQLVSEISHGLSLSLRLFGNIGGEFIVALLVLQAAPYGIPLVIHALGLIPAFIQPLVFTLLTSNFLAGAIHVEEEKPKETKEPKPVTSEISLKESAANGS
ncbi:MAG: FoF1 ATP synthase subunit a [Actinomycetota bacterium]